MKNKYGINIPTLDSLQERDSPGLLSRVFNRGGNQAASAPANPPYQIDPEIAQRAASTGNVNTNREYVQARQELWDRVQADRNAAKAAFLQQRGVDPSSGEFRTATVGGNQITYYVDTEGNMTEVPEYLANPNVFSATANSNPGIDMSDPQQVAQVEWRHSANRSSPGLEARRVPGVNVDDNDRITQEIQNQEAQHQAAIAQQQADPNAAVEDPVEPAMEEAPVDPVDPSIEIPPEQIAQPEPAAPGTPQPQAPEQPQEVAQAPSEEAPTETVPEPPTAEPAVEETPAAAPSEPSAPEETPEAASPEETPEAASPVEEPASAPPPPPVEPPEDPAIAQALEADNIELPPDEPVAAEVAPETPTEQPAAETESGGAEPAADVPAEAPDMDIPDDPNLPTMEIPEVADVADVDIPDAGEVSTGDPASDIAMMILRPLAVAAISAGGAAVVNKVRQQGQWNQASVTGELANTTLGTMMTGVLEKLYQTQDPKERNKQLKAALKKANIAYQAGGNKWIPLRSWEDLQQAAVALQNNSISAVAKSA